MKDYIILFDREFVKEYDKLDNSIKIEAEKKLKRLKENPHEFGKPLKYFSNLYELHVRMYRIFYVIEEAQIKILVLAIEHKDNTDRYLKRLTKEEIKSKLFNA